MGLGVMFEVVNQNIEVLRTEIKYWTLEKASEGFPSVRWKN